MSSTLVNVQTRCIFGFSGAAVSSAKVAAEAAAVLVSTLVSPEVGLPRTEPLRSANFPGVQAPLKFDVAIQRTQCPGYRPESLPFALVQPDLDFQSRTAILLAHLFVKGYRDRD